MTSRSAAALVVAAMAATSGATDISRAWLTFAKALKDKGVWQGQQQKGNPLQPSGFPGLPPKEGQLPPPVPGEEGKPLKLITAPESFQSGSKIQVSGGIHVQYRGYDIYGDSLEGDTDTEVFVITGSVKLLGVDAVIVGARVQVNFKDKTFVAEQSESQLSPSVFEGRVLDNVYAKGMRVYGEEKRIFADRGGLTTCNLDHPHYEIAARSTEIRAGTRIILKDARLRLFDRTVLSVPFLSIPLDERDDRYLPQVGQSRDEGYYIKSKFGFPLKGDDLVDTYLDYFTKLGLGIGANLIYQEAFGRGNFKVYGLTGTSRTLTLNQSHQGRLGSANLNVFSTLQRATYFNAPENTMFDTRWNLSLPNRGGATRFGFGRTTNESPNFSYLNQSYSLSDSRQIGKTTRISLDTTMSENRNTFGSTTTERKQIDVRFQGQTDLAKAIALLEYQRSIPVGATTNYFSSADRTPVFTLRSDAQRLFGRKTQEEIPFQTELSMGEFFDPSAKVRVTRGNFDLALAKASDSNKRLSVDFNGRYRQGWYSDDTAQYTLTLNGGVRYGLGGNRGLNVRYSFLRPYGFSPLQIDRTGRTNYISTDLTVQPMRNFTLAAQTGYDFLLEQQDETAWQSVGFRAEWRPRSWFNLRGLSTYDPVSHTWNSLRFDMAWRAGAAFVAAGARYDGIRKQWGAVNLYVDGFKAGRLKSSFLLAYNGYLKKFDTRQFSFTYDLHCAEAILEILDTPTGFRPGTTVNFFLRLKAIPFDTAFGVGRRGAPFGTGTGRDGF